MATREHPGGWLGASMRPRTRWHAWSLQGQETWPSVQGAGFTLSPCWGRGLKTEAGPNTPQQEKKGARTDLVTRRALF